MAKVRYSDNLDKYFSLKTSSYNFRRVYKKMVDICENNKLNQKEIREILNMNEFQIEVLQDKRLLATLKINKTVSAKPKYIKGMEPIKPGPRHIPGSGSEFGIGSDSPDADSGGHSILFELTSGKTKY